MTAGPAQLLDRVRAATSDEYIIEGELGRGGMAAVFLGRDIALDRRVAIKVLLPDVAGVAGSQDRFVVEARTAAGLDHPGIVTVHAVKQRAGLTFIVMKYIEGQTLDRVLARGPLDSAAVATIGRHVAEALDFAHSRGVIHRDVKPSNIIIDPQGRPVVTDFGIAKVSTSPALTMAGSVIGTPTYMSPEQCRGLAVTAASDQYSLGVMLYELLTGKPPFSGALFDLLKAQVGDAPPPILSIKPDADPALEAIVTIMLAKNERERFPSLHDVSRALAALVPRRSQAAGWETIMAAVGPDLLGPPSMELPEAPSAPMKEIAPVPPVAEAPPVAVFVADAAPPRSGAGKRVAAIAVATVLLAAVAYAIASRTGGTKTVVQAAPSAGATKADSVAPVTPVDSISMAKPETSLTAHVDSALPSKRDTTTVQAPVTDSKSNAFSTKASTSRPAHKRDSVDQTRPDSAAARCAALNLKFTLGEDVTRADSIFLRRECAKNRPRTPMS